MLGTISRNRTWTGEGLARRARLAISRAATLVIDPFEHLLRSIERDALPLDRVRPKELRMGASDAQPTPDLAEFVTQHYARLIRLAGLITRNTSDAEDAVQAALERAWKRRAWKRRADLRDAGLLKQWLDRIVVNEANRISGSRVRRLARLFTGAEAGAEAEEPLDVPDSRGQTPLEMAEMRQAFTRLSSDQRAVVILHLYAGYSVAETAEVIGAPVETIRSRLRLARQKLRAELEAGR